MNKLFANIIILFFNFLTKPARTEEIMLNEGTKKFYETKVEKDRLLKKWNRLEKIRVEQILEKYLPKSPAIIADVGGGTGVYSYFLSNKGYSLYLIDPVSVNIEQAKKNKKDRPLKDCIIGDARKIPLKGSSVDVVLFFGPLYHLDKKNRNIALQEAYRILKPNGLILCQGMPKHSLLFNYYFDEKINNPEKLKILEHCLKTGSFEYKGGVFYTHTPEELKIELETAGFKSKDLLAIEGLAPWLNLEYWENENLRKDLLHFIEETQYEPSILGVSAHFMAIGQKK